MIRTLRSKILTCIFITLCLFVISSSSMAGTGGISRKSVDQEVARSLFERLIESDNAPVNHLLAHDCMIHPKGAVTRYYSARQPAIITGTVPVTEAEKTGLSVLIKEYATPATQKMFYIGIRQALDDLKQRVAKGDKGALATLENLGFPKKKLSRLWPASLSENPDNNIFGAIKSFFAVAEKNEERHARLYAEGNVVVGSLPYL